MTPILVYSKRIFLLSIACLLWCLLYFSLKTNLIKMKHSSRHFEIEPKRKVKSVDCLSIFNNDKTEIDKALDQMEENRQIVNHPPVNISEEFSCKDLIEKNGYITSSLTKEEKDFPIAYSILIFKKPRQLERLLRAIYMPQNFYCIHVDRKTFSHDYNAVERLASCFPNVFISSQRINVVWGFTVFEAELACMQDLLKYKWKYFINLTGQEYPLKTNWELVKILTAFDGANNIEGTIKRANNDRFQMAGKTPDKLIPVKGATHIIACRGYIEFAMNDKRASRLAEWSRLTPHPEEVFFSTLNYNPSLRVPGAYLGEPESGPKNPFLARFKNWGERRCYGKRVRSVCILGVEDLHYLYKTRKMFANKFYDDFQPLTLDCLEELIYNRTAQLQYNFDEKWWKNLSFVKNRIR